MTTDPPTLPESRSRPIRSLPGFQIGSAAPPLAVLEHGLRTTTRRQRLWGAFLVVAALILVALISLLDYGTGRYLSLGIFYLVPVALCAWWGGFPHGIL